MSFHPLMEYNARFQKSERKVADAGPPFTFTPERRKQLDDERLRVRGRDLR